MEARLRGALERVGAHLGHARVVVGPGAPERLEPLAHGGDARARLPRVDRRPDPEGRRVDALRARDLREVERVRRRADEGGRAELPDRVEPRRRVLAAARDGHRAEDPRPLQSRPEADEQAERERKEEPVAAPEPRRPEHEGPAAGPPGSTTPRSRASGSAAPSCPRSGRRERSARAGRSGWCRTAGGRLVRRPAPPLVSRGRRAKSVPRAEVARVAEAGALEARRARTRSSPRPRRAPAVEPLPTASRGGSPAAPSPARGRETRRRPAAPERSCLAPGGPARGAAHDKDSAPVSTMTAWPPTRTRVARPGTPCTSTVEPAGPTVEVALLRTEPRHAAVGGQHARLPEPRADRRVGRARRRVLRDPEVRDEVAAVGQGARLPSVSRAVRTTPRTPRSFGEASEPAQVGREGPQRLEAGDGDQEVLLRRPRGRRPVRDGARGPARAPPGTARGPPRSGVQRGQSGSNHAVAEAPDPSR